MPASITHYEFIKKTVKNEKYFDVVALAGQGPDPFFFYGYSLAKRKNVKEVRQFGTLLHHMDIAPVYNFLLNYATSKSGEEQEVLLAFIKGLMYHYALDRNTHPYIFYISGFSELPEEKRKYSLEHAKVESAIDAIMKKKCHEKKNINQMLKVSKAHLKLISKMFYCLGNYYFNFAYIQEDTYEKCVKDMRLVNHVLNSPLKIKKLIFMTLFKSHELNAMSAPLNVTKLKKYDLFNSRKQKWLNCVNGNIRFESFYELFDNAKKETESINHIISLAKGGLDVLEDLEEFVRGIDHDGFQVGAKKKYFKLVLGK